MGTRKGCVSTQTVATYKPREEASERCPLGCPLGLRPPSPQNYAKINICCFSNPVCDTSMEYHEQTNTGDAMKYFYKRGAGIRTNKTNNTDFTPKLFP